MAISLISCKTLLSELATDPRAYSIIDAREFDAFDAGHIPGAVSIAWENWCSEPPNGCERAFRQPGYWGLLADPIGGRFARDLSELGLSNSRRVVVYGQGADSWGTEGRIAWMLLYLGAGQVFMLDGGWQNWLVGGGPIAYDRPTTVAPSEFRINIDGKRRAHLERLAPLCIERQLPLLVDTRSAWEFAGTGPDYHRRNGHLPNSVLFPFESLYDQTGCFISRERYMQLAAPQILSAELLIAYCEVGVRAATFALLHEAYTGKTVPLFDGSLVEWASYRSLPVLTT